MKRSVFLVLAAVVLFTQCGRVEKNKGISEFASVSQTSTGKPVGVVMTTYTTTMLADGKDQTLIRACVVDSAGREITTANVPITISVTGDAEIAGTKNGIPVSLIKTENGTKVWSSKIARVEVILILPCSKKICSAIKIFLLLGEFIVVCGY